MSNYFQKYKQKAHAELNVVAELIGPTYDFSKDTKLLVSALHHLKDAQNECIKFIMYLEGKEEENPDLELFNKLMKQKSSLNTEELQTIVEVHQLCQEQKDSDVEFRRKESYILCDDSYKLSTLTQEKLQKYLKQTISITKKILR